MSFEQQSYIQLKYLYDNNNHVNRDINDDDLIRICDGMNKYGITKMKEIK